MTGNRHFAKEQERRQREAIKEMKRVLFRFKARSWFAGKPFRIEPLGSDFWERVRERMPDRLPPPPPKHEAFAISTKTIGFRERST